MTSGPRWTGCRCAPCNRLDELRMTWGSANPPWWCGPGSAGAVGLSVPGDVRFPNETGPVHGHRPGVDAEQPHLVADIIDRLVVAGYPPGELDDITLFAESGAAPVRYRRPGAAFEHGLKPRTGPATASADGHQNATRRSSRRAMEDTAWSVNQRTPSIRTTLPAAANAGLSPSPARAVRFNRSRCSSLATGASTPSCDGSAKEGCETDSLSGRVCERTEPTSPRAAARTRTGSPNQPWRSGPLDHPPRTGIVPRVRRR